MIAKDKAIYYDLPT